MLFNLSKNSTSSFQNKLFSNSSWGIIAHASQTILTTLFFVILAREYSTNDFASYLIATVIYQLCAAFATLGLSQWFIRELKSDSDRSNIVNKFLKVQVYSGFVFYLVNLVFAYYLYDEKFIFILALLFGVNIVFDNLINAVKCLNIADFEQKKTLILLTAEAFLKFICACILFVYPFSIINLAIMLIIIRFITLNLFLTFGSSNVINIKKLWNYKLPWDEAWLLIKTNWPFLIISGAAMINWRFASIIISKTLTSADVAIYEISYKIFYVAQIIPIIISTTIFPELIRIYNEGNFKKLRSFYKQMQSYYFLFGLFAFTFIFSFSNLLIPFIFGDSYANTSVYTKQMFLTILVFPTAFLQSNMLISMKLEKLDMWLNVISLLINLTLCLVGLYFFKSLTSINLSIFFAFLVFLILQDIILIKRKVTNLKSTLENYLKGLLAVCTYVVFSYYFNPFLLFFSFWIIALLFRARLNFNYLPNITKHI